eukprot:TRINITY_DN3659_c0_g1_i1.p3 TRINITY_DN3659_c0_g1~~TRINITY_DN3659_c0_g1_i1.p3  ORF type:complete len:119 (+),score=26.64 TRINITY_DN3659_c0_g1_i1:69-425(+)
MIVFFFFNDTATTEIYTLHIVGSVRCVQETGYQRRVHGHITNLFVFLLYITLGRSMIHPLVMSLFSSSETFMAMPLFFQLYKSEEEQQVTPTNALLVVSLLNPPNQQYLPWQYSIPPP